MARRNFHLLPHHQTLSEIDEKSSYLAIPSRINVYQQSANRITNNGVNTTMANFRTRRRRIQRNRRVSNRLDSYRVVEGQRPLNKNSAAQRRSSTLGRALARRIVKQLPKLQRTRPLKRKANSPMVREAARRVSLLERPQRLRKKPCIQRPNSRLAGLASARSGSGHSHTREQRLDAFRVWCR